MLNRRSSSGAHGANGILKQLGNALHRIEQASWGRKGQHCSRCQPLFLCFCFSQTKALVLLSWETP